MAGTASKAAGEAPPSKSNGKASPPKKRKRKSDVSNPQTDERPAKKKKIRASSSQPVADSPKNDPPVASSSNVTLDDIEQPVKKRKKKKKVKEAAEPVLIPTPASIDTSSFIENRSPSKKKRKRKVPSVSPLASPVKTPATSPIIPSKPITKTAARKPSKLREEIQPDSVDAKGKARQVQTPDKTANGMDRSFAAGIAAAITASLRLKREAALSGGTPSSTPSRVTPSTKSVAAKKAPPVKAASKSIPPVKVTPQTAVQSAASESSSEEEGSEREDEAPTKYIAKPTTVSKANSRPIKSLPMKPKPAQVEKTTPSSSVSETSSEEEQAVTTPARTKPRPAVAKEAAIHKTNSAAPPSTSYTLPVSKAVSKRDAQTQTRDDSPQVPKTSTVDAQIQTDPLSPPHRATITSTSYNLTTEILRARRHADSLSRGARKQHALEDEDSDAMSDFSMHMEDWSDSDGEHSVSEKEEVAREHSVMEVDLPPSRQSVKHRPSSSSSEDSDSEEEQQVVPKPKSVTHPSLLGLSAFSSIPPKPSASLASIDNPRSSAQFLAALESQSSSESDSDPDDQVPEQGYLSASPEPIIKRRPVKKSFKVTSDSEEEGFSAYIQPEDVDHAIHPQSNAPAEDEAMQFDQSIFNPVLSSSPVRQVGKLSQHSSSSEESESESEKEVPPKQVSPKEVIPAVEDEDSTSSDSEGSEVETNHSDCDKSKSPALANNSPSPHKRSLSPAKSASIMRSPARFVSPMNVDSPALTQIPVIAEPDLIKETDNTQTITVNSQNDQDTIIASSPVHQRVSSPPQPVEKHRSPTPLNFNLHPRLPVSAPQSSALARKVSFTELQDSQASVEPSQQDVGTEAVQEANELDTQHFEPHAQEAADNDVPSQSLLQQRYPNPDEVETEEQSEEVLVPATSQINQTQYRDLELLKEIRESLRSNENYIPTPTHSQTSSQIQPQSSPSKLNGLYPKLDDLQLAEHDESSLQTDPETPAMPTNAQPLFKPVEESQLATNDTPTEDAQMVIDEAQPMEESVVADSQIDELASPVPESQFDELASQPPRLMRVTRSQSANPQDPPKGDVNGNTQINGISNSIRERDDSSEDSSDEEPPTILQKSPPKSQRTPSKFLGSLFLPSNSQSRTVIDRPSSSSVFKLSSSQPLKVPSRISRPVQRKSLSLTELASQQKYKRQTRQASQEAAAAKEKAQTETKRETRSAKKVEESDSSDED